MTDREALLACRQSVAFNLASWRKWLKKDGDYCARKTAEVKAKIRQLRELLDYIEGIENEANQI